MWGTSLTEINNLNQLNIQSFIINLPKMCVNKKINDNNAPNRVTMYACNM